MQFLKHILINYSVPVWSYPDSVGLRLSLRALSGR